MSKLQRKQTHRWEKIFILRGICFSTARKLLKARCCSFERMDDNHVSGWSLLVQGMTVRPTSSGHSGSFSHDSPSPKRPPLWNEVCWKSLSPCICGICFFKKLLNAVIYWKMCLLCMNYLAGFCSSKIQACLLLLKRLHIIYIYIYICSWPPQIIHRLVGPLPMEQSRFFWASRWWEKSPFGWVSFNAVD